MSENDDGADDEATDLPAESLEQRVEDAAEAVEAAETEADLDEAEAALDDVESDLEDADLPEPDDDDEDGPRAELESRLSSVRDDLEAARGPYAEDVADEIGDVQSTIQQAEWTESGVADLTEAVESFADAVESAVGTAVAVEQDEVDWSEPKVQGARLRGLGDALDGTAEAVTDAGLDADDDAETIETLLDAVDALDDDVEAAEAWSDLSVRRQLEAMGYYEPLEHRKDFPPEWAALKVWEDRGRADMVLLALEKLESDYMERHCMEALRRMGPEEALDEMVDRAQKRNEDAIEVLGKIADPGPTEGLLNYVDADDPNLRRATLKALGEIGSEDATQDVADQLAADEPSVRSQAARALGLIGDTRAIEPLADVLADDDVESVRAAAGWALNQIGTERALDAVAEYGDDRSYLVQAEAEKAA